MQVLFDQGTPVPLRGYLLSHSVSTVFEKGWSTMQNGELLDVAEQQGFEIFVTTDQNLKHQQNLASRRIAIVVLPTTSWPVIESQAHKVLAAINGATPSAYVEIKL